MFWLSLVHCGIPVSGCRRALLGLLLIFGAVCARADTYEVTFINVTFSATCIGGGTCTEVINGSGLYDPATDTASKVSIVLTGTLNASLNSYGAPTCTAPGCLQPNVLYDSGALPGFNPIEFSPAIAMFDAPTPQPLLPGAGGAILFVPGQCGGDQPACNSNGAFPGGPNADYTLTSGTYTSVDLGPSAPEPASAFLLVTGAAIAGFLGRRKAHQRRS